MKELIIKLNNIKLNIKNNEKHYFNNLMRLNFLEIRKDKQIDYFIDKYMNNLSYDFIDRSILLNDILISIIRTKKSIDDFNEKFKYEIEILIHNINNIPVVNEKNKNIFFKKCKDNNIKILINLILKNKNNLNKIFSDINIKYENYIKMLDLFKLKKISGELNIELETYKEKLRDNLYKLSRKIDNYEEKQNYKKIQYHNIKNNNFDNYLQEWERINRYLEMNNFNV